MIQRIQRPPVALGFAALILVSGMLTACRRKEPPAPPMATPSVTLSHDKTPLGSPIDINYKFIVASNVLSNLQFFEGTNFYVRCSRKDIKELRGFLSNKLVDVAPRVLTS